MLQPRITFPYFQNNQGLQAVGCDQRWQPDGQRSDKTDAGHPIATATENKTVFPLPYPRDLYMAGANRGNPNPASDLRVPTAARADAE